MLLGVLITILIIVCVLLIAVILMQRSEGGALGMGGGGGGGFMSSRGAADLLTRTTQWLGTAFFVLCLAITVVTARTQNSGSLIDRANVGKIDAGLLGRDAAPAQPAPAAPAPGGFQAPPPNLGGLPSSAPAPAPAQPFPSAPAPAPGR
jgi:preprotein translocase subunit SecG